MGHRLPPTLTMYFSWRSLVLFLACVPRMSSMEMSDLSDMQPPEMKHAMFSMNSLGKHRAHKECGVVAKMPNGHFNFTHVYQNGTLPDDMCSHSLLINCTESYSAHCPSSCNVVAMHPIFPCMYKCVRENQCSDVDPGRTYAMPELGMCTQCVMPLCKLCVKDASGNHKCQKCYDQFELQDDGTCMFYMDKYMPSPAQVELVLAITVAVIIVFAIIWCTIFGQHPERHRHMRAIMRGRRHRHLTKTTMWHMKQERAREWIGIFANMHTNDFFGLGAALFYNAITFLFVVSLICFLAVSKLYSGADMHGVLMTTGVALNTMEDEVRMMPHGLPAMVISPLHSCAHESQTAGLLFLNFARKKCAVLGLLYIVIFLLSLAFASFQKFWDGNFDKNNASMSDYALWVDGLPKELTDEGKLRRWFETEFRKWDPEDQPRSETHKLKVSDEEQVIEDTPIEVHAVSICYDYFEQKDEVADALWKMMEITEVRMDETMDVDDTQVAGEGKTLDEFEGELKDKVSPYFMDGDKKLKGTGQAYVVFKYQTDKNKIEDLYGRGKRLKHPDGGEELRWTNSQVEPPNVQWWYFGLSEPDRKKRVYKFVGKLALIVLVMQGCVTFPYNYFVVWPYSSTGTAASGVKVTIAGIILGNANWICFLSNYLTAEQIGYRTKDWLFIFVFISNTIVVYVLTGCNTILTSAQFVSHSTRAHVGAKDYFDMVIASIGQEVAFTRNIYNMLQPGGFFVGAVMCAIMAGVIPYTLTTLFSKVIYVWRCLPEFLLKIVKNFLAWSPPTVNHYPTRSAEKGLEPWEVPICGNYADFIVTPSLCFFLLFFLSPFSYRVLEAMTKWCIFMYIYFRWMHLRYHKTCFYQSYRMENIFHYLWGIPLSVLAAACCCWALRAKLILQDQDPLVKIALICLTFLVSALIWVTVLHFAIRPWTRKEVADHNQSLTYQEVQGEAIYSWLNCNPVFVLKCRYYFQEANGMHITSRINGHPLSVGKEGQVLFFDIGKQFLFLTKKQREHLFAKNVKNSLEFETWYEFILNLVGFVSARCCQKANSLDRNPSEQGFLEGS